MTKSTCYRLLLTVFLISGLGGCCDEHIPYWTISDLSFEVYDETNHVFADSAIYFPATAPYRLIIVNEIEFITSVGPSISDLFIQQALAFQCPDPGEDGMKDSIVSIELTSNHTFNGIPAGQSLNDQIRIENTLTVDEFLQFTGSLHPLFGRAINITFTERPVNSTHQFTIRLGLESGKTFTARTVEVTWE